MCFLDYDWRTKEFWMMHILFSRWNHYIYSLWVYPRKWKNVKVHFFHWQNSWSMSLLRQNKWKNQIFSRRQCYMGVKTCWQRTRRNSWFPICKSNFLHLSVRGHWSDILQHLDSKEYWKGNPIQTWTWYFHRSYSSGQTIGKFPTYDPYKTSETMLRHFQHSIV